MWTALQVVAAKSWIEVPAIIHDVSFDRIKSRSRGGGYTYITRARYEYEFNGIKHSGSKVSLFIGADNLGSFQKDVYDELAHYRDIRAPFHFYVDPNHPEVAVLYRIARIGLLSFFLFAAFVFAGIGLGAIAFTYVVYRDERRQNQLKRSYPDTPWLHRTEWKLGRIPTKGYRKTISSIAAAMLFFIFSSPVLLVLQGALEENDNIAVLFSLCFVVAAALSALWALRNLLHYLKYGKAALVLSKIPIAPGSTFKGTINVPADINTTNVEISLDCWSVTIDRIGTKTRSTPTQLWQHVTTARTTRGSSGSTIIPVEIYIPESLPWTKLNSSTGSTTWTLRAKAKVSGPDFNVAFEIPVFQEFGSPQ